MKNIIAFAISYIVAYFTVERGFIFVASFYYGIIVFIDWMFFSFLTTEWDNPLAKKLFWRYKGFYTNITVIGGYLMTLTFIGVTINGFKECVSLVDLIELISSFDLDNKIICPEGKGTYAELSLKELLLSPLILLIIPYAYWLGKYNSEKL